jgi:hypothetical protein
VTDSAASRLLSGVRWATWLWCSGLAGGALLAAAPAAADVPTRLVYVRTPEAAVCPDQAALQKAVEARLGHDPFSIWGENTVIATVSAHGTELRARAEFVDGAGVMRGSRDVVGRATDCDELILALALAISITLDPMQATAMPAEQGLETRVEPEPVAPPQPAPAQSADHEKVRRGPRQPNTPLKNSSSSSWSAHAGVFGSAGAVPSIASGARLGLRFERQAFSGGIELAASWPSSKSLGEDRSVNVSIFVANVFPCITLVRGLFGCALGSFGVFRAHGEGVTDPRSETLGYAAVGGRLALELPVGTRWSFSSQADLLGTLTRPDFTLNQASVWRPFPVSAAFGVGISLSLS